MSPPKTHTVTYDELLAMDLTHAEPMLVTGIKVLPELWSPEDVVEAVGDTVVPIPHITKGDYVGSEIRDRSVRDYYTEMIQDLPSEKIPYLAELSYDEHFPALAAQLVEAPPLKDETFSQRVMYFGRGVHSQIHHHTQGSAMLFCIHGTKIVRLYGPDQTAKLYKKSGRNFSQVLVSSVGENSYVFDESKFPEFANAEYVEYEVNAGQVLFIPIWWWHSIQNLEGVSLTAVYFWNQSWKDSWRDLFPPELPPPGMRLDYARTMVHKYAINPLKGLRK